MKNSPKSVKMPAIAPKVTELLRRTLTKLFTSYQHYEPFRGHGAGNRPIIGLRCGALQLKCAAVQTSMPGQPVQEHGRMI
ncbi:hypothetical protein PI126_g7236 [Phytophthora idaei]|nr:hypothetical protein PI126_g7236 [Phytophthora idaei]